MGRFLMLAGVILVAVGFMIHLKVSIPWLTSWIGKLPGDIVIKKPHGTIYFPIATSLLLSAIVSLLLSFIFRSSK